MKKTDQYVNGTAAADYGRLRELFRPFGRRLKAESAGNAALIALMAGAACGAALFVVSLFSKVAIEFGACCAAAGIAFVISFAVLFLRRRHSMKEIAERIDSTGTGNRAEAAVGLIGDGSDFAKLQREDTVRRIAEVKPSSVKLRIKKEKLIAAALAVLLFAGCAFIPNLNLNRIRAREAQTVAEQKKAEELIKDLEKRIEDADLLPENREEAKKVIDDLRDRLAEAENNSDRLAAVNEASSKIDDIIKKDAGQKNAPAQDAMKRAGQSLEGSGNKTLSDLGKAMEKGEEGKTESEKLSEQLKKEVAEAAAKVGDKSGATSPAEAAEAGKQLSDIAGDLKEAAEAAGSEAGGEELEKALNEAAEKIEKMAEGGSTESAEAAEAQASEALEQLAEEIKKANSGSEAGESAAEGIQQTIDNYKKSLAETAENDPSRQGGQGQQGQQGQQGGQGQQGTR